MDETLFMDDIYQKDSIPHKWMTCDHINEINLLNGICSTNEI